EPSPQRTPVLYQAGASTRGRSFGAKHAEATFINSPTIARQAQSVAKTSEELEKTGRDPSDIRIFGMQTIITGATDGEAQEKYRDLAQYGDVEGALSLMSGWMGTDFAKYDLDAPIGHIESNAIQSAAETFRKASGDGEEWTVRKLAEWVGVGGFGP